MPDFDPDVADIYRSVASGGHDSPTVQGYLVFIAERVARNEVSDFTQRAAAAVVAGLRAYEQRGVAA